MSNFKHFNYILLYFILAVSIYSYAQAPIDPKTGKEIYTGNTKEPKTEKIEKITKTDTKKVKQQEIPEPQKQSAKKQTKHTFNDGMDYANDLSQHVREIYIDPIEDFQHIYFHYKGSDEIEQLGDSVIIGMKLEKHTTYILQIKQEEYIHPLSQTNAIRYILVKQIFPVVTLSQEANPIGESQYIDDGITLNIDYRLDDNNMLRIKQPNDNTYIAFEGSIWGFDYSENHLYQISVKAIDSDYKLIKIESEKYVGEIVPNPKTIKYADYMESVYTTTDESTETPLNTHNIILRIDYLIENNHIRVKKEGEEKFQEFFWSIFGFTYTEGHSYLLEVQSMGLNYKLIKIKKDTKQDFFSPVSYQIFYFPDNPDGKINIETHYTNSGYKAKDYYEANKKSGNTNQKNKEEIQIQSDSQNTNNAVSEPPNTQNESPLKNLKPKEIEKKQDEEIVFERTDVNPVFSGGNAELLKFIENNLVYSDEIINNSISGKVTVKLIIDTDGSVNNPTVVKDIIGCSSCADEAIRVCYKMPNWTPGMIKGKAVKSYFYMQIFFRNKN